MSPNQPENDETLEALAQRLRYLPPPPVPSGLEERLLATIPSRRRASRARFWQAASILLAAAACLLSRAAPAATASLNSLRSEPLSLFRRSSPAPDLVDL